MTTRYTKTLTVANGIKTTAKSNRANLKQNTIETQQKINRKLFCFGDISVVRTSVDFAVVLVT